MHSISEAMIHEDSDDITADEEVALIHSASQRYSFPRLFRQGMRVKV